MPQTEPDRRRRCEPPDDDRTVSTFYRRHVHLTRTALYHRARAAGVPQAAALSKAELIHALARSELGCLAA